MNSPSESHQKATCPAEAVLTNDEVNSLDLLPGVLFEIDTEPLRCEFTMHDAGVPHAVSAQAQDTGGELILWWLLWNNDGYRELRTAPGCHRIVTEESCLLIGDHPGECNQGLTGEELREALGSWRNEGKA